MAEKPSREELEQRIREIAERKQVETALRESERRYRDILDVSPAVITIHRREDERFLQVNPAFFKLTGYEPEEVIGKTISDLKLVPDVHYRRAVAKAFGASGEINGFETKLRIKDGSIIEILLSGRKLVYDGKDSFLIAFTDITSVKRAEAELRKHRDHLEELVDHRTRDLKRTNDNLQKEIAERKKVERALKKARDEAETANRAKSEFLANMSHEIRTPMNGVIGMTELLMGTRLSAQQKDYAEGISVSANALLKIINDILDISKIQAGKLALESVAFNLRKVVDQIGWVMAGQARKKGLDILVWYPPDAPSRVIGDPTRIQQILTNLSSNAVKFTERGHVLIEVEPENKVEDRRRFLIKVSDTGGGIPKARQESIFGKFSQADESMTRKYGGTGLGLAISKQLVEIMGGSIGVKSMPGKGSTFYFRLELPCEEDATEDVDIRRGLSDIPVLVVDDNKINRRIATRYLQSRDIPCHASPSGEDALEVLRCASRDGRPYRIAVLDYYMPKMSGGELAEAIKEDEEIRDTVLILLSSGVLLKDLMESTQRYFAAGLLKPIRIAPFLQTLLEAWENSQKGFSRRPVMETPDLKAKDALPTIDADVLLVEDNAMNQRVAAGMLKRFGCRVDIAENGVAAVNLFQEKSYDIVFMDAHMPMMDGFETTRYIRGRESGERRVPIIAMTALAMEGDRERCLDAGMDDYIPKPIVSKAIRRVLLKNTADRRSAPTPAPSAPPETRENRERPLMLLNPGQLIDISGNDEETIRELIAEFMKDAPRYLNDLEEAVRGGDAVRVFKTAHRLKGLVANAGAEKLQQMVLEIENGAREGSVDSEKIDLASLAAELAKLERALGQTDWKTLCG
ncbi:MAG: response regulator [Desulfobacterales bacterium]|nr:response regulator [Desulfobacterales bacterium]